MKLIDADKYVCALVFDGEHEEQRTETMTIEDFLDSFTEEGCPVQEVAEMKWTPCSERLPEEKGEYLVTYHPCYWDNVQQDIKVGIDSFRGKTSWAKKKHRRVIAWMPLPEPYKENKE